MRTVCGGGQVILKRSNILPNNLIPDLLRNSQSNSNGRDEPLPNTVIKSVQFYKPQGLSDVASDEFDQDWFTVGQSVRARQEARRRHVEHSSSWTLLILMRKRERIKKLRVEAQ